jgi:hypothetical protein
MTTGWRCVSQTRGCKSEDEDEDRRGREDEWESAAGCTRMMMPVRKELENEAGARDQRERDEGEGGEAG